MYLLSLLSSQNSEAGLFVTTQTGPGYHFRLDKCCPAKASFGKRGTKITHYQQERTIFDNQKWSGDHFWQPKSDRGTAFGWDRFSRDRPFHFGWVYVLQRRTLIGRRTPVKRLPRAFFSSAHSDLSLGWPASRGID